MRPLWRTACLLLVASAVTVTVTLAAQEGQGNTAPRQRPGIPKTDQQMSGEALFYQKCPLCHVYTARTEAARSRTELVGLYKQPSITDEAVRALIMGGIPGRMSSFRYSLMPQELDDLIAYLKIR